MGLYSNLWQPGFVGKKVQLSHQWLVSILENEIGIILKFIVLWATAIISKNYVNIYKGYKLIIRTFLIIYNECLFSKLFKPINSILTCKTATY